MSGKVKQALRITAEWWDRVELVECTDDVHDYNNRSAVLVAQANADVLVYTKALDDDQIARLRPMVTQLALALQAEARRRKKERAKHVEHQAVSAELTDCERQVCGPTGSHDATCSGLHHYESA